MSWEKGKHYWYSSFQHNNQLMESEAISLFNSEGCHDPNDYPVGTTKKAIWDAGNAEKKERTYTVRIIK